MSEHHEDRNDDRAGAESGRAPGASEHDPGGRPPVGEEVPLTAEEDEALAALPRERAPGELLRHRVVGALRAEGLIGAGSGAPGELRQSPFETSPGPISRGPSSRWWAGAAAAAIALFLGGLSLGQSIGARTTAGAMAAWREAEADVTATRIQQIGSSYVGALATLAESGRAGRLSAEEVTRGRAVARAILVAAITELARIDPAEADIALALDVLRAPEPEPSMTGRIVRTASF